jgi:hypothetical protein
VYADPANREGFRRSALRSELRASPGCGLEGAVTGVAEIGNLGMIGTVIRATCAENVTRATSPARTAPMPSLPACA